MYMFQIASHPSNINSGKGRSIAQLAALNSENTTFIGIKKKNEKLEPLGDYELIEFKFDHPPMSQSFGYVKMFYIGAMKSLYIVLANVTLYIKLRALIKKKRLEYSQIVINLHSIFVIIGVILLPGYVKKIYTFRGGDYEIYKNNKFVQFLFKPFDGLNFVSKAQFEEQCVSHKKSFFVGNAIDLSQYTFGKRLHEPCDWIVVSGLREVKRVELAIKLFAAYCKIQNGTKLKIYGDGPNRNKVDQLVQKLKLQDKVTLYGNQSEAVVANALATSNVFVLLSKSEGLPKALLEAMASNCKLVISDLRTLRHITKNAAFFISNQDDINLIVNELSEYLNSHKAKQDVVICKNIVEENYSLAAHNRMVTQSYSL